MKLRRILFIGVLGLTIGLAAVATAWAQENGLALGLSKDWGFSQGGQIQGRFSLSVSGPKDLASVSFQVDGAEVASLAQPPFRWQFDTSQYSLGRHTFTATGRTFNGQALTSNTISAELVSSAQAWQSTQRIMIPLLGLVGAVLIVSLVSQFVLAGRNTRRPEPGMSRHYGIEGGAICPRCGRPFARHLFGLNLVVGKLERCPYCGKWSVVQRASPQALAAAEAAEVEASKPSVPEQGPEEQLRRNLEESKYQ